MRTVGFMAIMAAAPSLQFIFCSGDHMYGDLLNGAHKSPKLNSKLEALVHQWFADFRKTPICTCHPAHWLKPAGLEHQAWRTYFLCTTLQLLDIPEFQPDRTMLGKSKGKGREP